MVLLSPGSSAPPPLGTAHAQVRVVVVDDSSVVRHVLRDVLAGQPGLTLVATARDGMDAISVIERSHPHVVVLDVEMPVLDGLGALREIRKRWPKLPVVMFSTLTERGAAATLEALAEGADDYLTKPTSTGGPNAALSAVSQQLVPLLRMWGSIGRRREGAAPTGAPAPPPALLAPARPAVPVTTPAPARPSLPLPGGKPVSAVVIGCSTGGPNALAAVLPGLSATFPVPVLVVQHMPPMFTRLLAERLDRLGGLRVSEAVAGTVARPGHLYVARGGAHLAVRRAHGEVLLSEDEGAPENSCKPAVDVLFRSAAAVWGGGVMAVVLTGMGQDGMLGAQAVSAAGGFVVAQDEASSVVWGMPGAVVKAGLARQIVSLTDVAPAIDSHVRAGAGRAPGLGPVARPSMERQ
jgi:two-component system, chemotaxis family, protein-glutamate methylesterase/glutaminase